MCVCAVLPMTSRERWECIRCGRVNWGGLGCNNPQCGVVHSVGIGLLPDGTRCPPLPVRRQSRIVLSEKEQQKIEEQRQAWRDRMI